MATYTANNGITKIAIGDEDGTWGTTENTNWDLTDTALDGQVTLALSGTTSTLTISSGVASDGRNRIIICEGSLSANHTITISPNTAEKHYFVQNNTTGGYSVLIKQGSGAQVTITNGYSQNVFCDGTGSGASVFVTTPKIRNTAISIGSVAGTAALTVNNNTVAVTPVATSDVHIIGADSSAARVLLDGFASGSVVTGRYANGTSAAPTACTTGNALATFSARGYGATAYSGTVGIVRISSEGTFTDASHPTNVTFWTTPSGSTTAVERMHIAPSGNIGIGTDTPATSALVDITSTTGALLLPRMTSTQRDALTAVNGMLIYNSTTNKLQVYENSAWANVI